MATKYFATGLRRLARASNPAGSLCAGQRLAAPRWAHNAPARLPTRLPSHAATASSHCRRWYSANSDPDAIPGSREWNFDEVKSKVKAGDQDVVFVDVREPPELFETGKIPGAINIPITTAIQSFHISNEDFEQMYGFPRPAKEQELVFYCKAGVRAKAAAGLAQHAGWQKVGVYYGSWLDWQKGEGPVEPVKVGDDMIDRD